MIAWYLTTAAAVFVMTLVAVLLSRRERVKDNIFQLIGCAIFWPVFILAITSFTIERHD